MNQNKYVNKKMIESFLRLMKQPGQRLSRGWSPWLYLFCYRLLENPNDVVGCITALSHFHIDWSQQRIGTQVIGH